MRRGQWLGYLVRGLAAGLAAVLVALFGALRWQPPGWTRRLALWSFAAAATVRARPGRSALTALLLVTLGAGGWAGLRWWQSRPQPQRVGYTVVDPARTEVERGTPPQPLQVLFDRPVAPLALVGKAADGIRIEPAIAGEWRWFDERELRFVPDGDWPVGGRYRVSLPQAALTPGTVLESRRFEFHPAPFEARIERTEFHQDPRDPAQKKAVVTLAFSHPVDPAAFESQVVLRMADSERGIWGISADTTAFVVHYDDTRTRAWIHSAPLPLPTQPSRIEVRIAAGVTAARGGDGTDSSLESWVAIPGRYTLSVGAPQLSVVRDEHDEPSQLLTLESSAAVHEAKMNAALRAWLLPLHAPPGRAPKGEAVHHWYLNQVDEQVLAAAETLPLTPVAAEREFTELHGYRFSAEVGRYLLVEVAAGVESFGGYRLAKRRLTVVRVPPYPPELHILGQGGLMSLGGEKKLAVLVRDLPGIKIEIGRLLPAQLQHLVSQSDGRFDRPRFRGYVGPDNLLERFEIARPLSLQHGLAHYEAVDLAPYLGGEAARRGVFLLTAQGYAPDGTAYDGNPAAYAESRLVLVTDLGLILKRELDGTLLAFVQSIASGRPVAGATVEVIGLNGQSLASGSSGEEGTVRFTGLDGLEREKRPLMLVVSKGEDMSFLPLGRRNRMLETSRFDVGGLANAVDGGQLDAYLFSDRGLYRPGETFHVGLVVRASDWTRPDARSLAGLPLQLEVLDPRGLTVRRERIRLAEGGFDELSHATLPASPTGTYTVNLYTLEDGRPQQQIGSTQVRLLSFEPDRMKVRARLSAESDEGWVHPRELAALVEVGNLFGTPAAERRVEADLTLSPAYPAFRSHPGYHFYDPLRAREGARSELPASTTDAHGQARFELGLEKYARATYRLQLLVRAYEAGGGRSVAAETSTLVSELPFLVGFRADGDLGYVARGGGRSVSLIAIDPSAQRTQATGLTLQRLERRHVSVLTREQSGLYRYQSQLRESVLESTPLAIEAGGATLALATDTPGDFAYQVLNADGLVLNRIDYSVAGNGNVARSLERNAELQLTLDQRAYAPGEEIAVSIRAPYAGAGLITIERDKVVAQRWFKSDSQASVQTIRVPPDFEGNGYVSVQFVRDPASDEIFTSPLSYGYAPFAVRLDRRRHALELKAPERIRPGETLALSLASEQPTRAVVFAVDEGILQVARQPLPDPLGHFFSKRRLEVETAQILDQILPEFSRLLSAAAPGGDAEAALGRHLNPFARKHDKPAVYWSGIVEVDGRREFRYPVPDTFNGSLRIVAVAVSEQRIGVARTDTRVRGDFVLSPNVPEMVAPGDEFEVSVGVANNLAGSGTDAQVEVALELPPGLQAIGPNRTRLPIGEQREGVARFRLRADDPELVEPGARALRFSAAIGDRRATLRRELSLRPASPYATLLSFGSFEDRIEVPVRRRLHRAFRHVEAGISTLPLVATRGLARYLHDFPHLCTEQLVSAALPKLVLADQPDFGRGADAPQDDRSTLAQAWRVLRTRQNAAGGFGLWRANVESHEFASVHAVLLMLEARERHAAVPDDMLARALGYLRTLAASPAADLDEARIRAQAAYLLTREGQVTTPMLSALREMLAARYPEQWQEDLAAVWLAGAYRLLQQQDLAERLIAPPARRLERRGEPFRYRHFYDPLIRDAGTLYVLARHFPDRARQVSPTALLAMMKPVTENRFNTLSAGMTLLALDALAARQRADGTSRLSIEALLGDDRRETLAPQGRLVQRIEIGPEAERLVFANGGSATTYWALAETGFDRQPPTEVLRDGLEVVREYLDRDGQPVDTVRLGEELIVRLRLRAVNRDYVPDVALVDLLPGGFEPVLRSQRPDEPNDDGPRDPLDGKGDWTPEHADIRDDRVVFYGSASERMAEFRYRIKAVSAGRFTVPPVYAESMYERDVRARAPGGLLTVEAPAP